jgi:amidase
VGGIPDCREHVPAENAVPVQRLVDAGAVVFGKTNVPFMSSDLQSFNEVYGTTNNPWDKSRTCGGSSGGASAAVAAGLTPLELGSDIGGSIRTPSHFNGIFGLKTSWGAISTHGHLPPGEQILSQDDLAVAGPLATCVDDLEGALNLIWGPDDLVATAPRFPLPDPSFQEPGSLRVAVWADDPFCPVDSEIVQHIEAAAEALAGLGAYVDRNARPALSFEESHINYTQLLMSAMGAGMPEEVFQMARDMVAGADADDMSEPMLQMRGIALSHRGWLKQNERRARLRTAWKNFFSDYDVLLCPCVHVPAFPHDHTPDMHARRLTVNGEERPYTELLRWAGLTLNAYLPAAVVPLGTTRDGLPIGMQIAAPFLGEKTSLAVARLLETHFRSFVAPPGYAN